MTITYNLAIPSAVTQLMADADKKVKQGKRMVVKLVEETKTERQRGYQWGYFYKTIVKLLNDAGIELNLEDGSEPYTSEILHEVLKIKVGKSIALEYQLIKPMKFSNGADVPQSISTESFPVKAFSEYIKRCEELLYSKYGIIVPLPEDCYYSQIAREIKG